MIEVALYGKPSSRYEYLKYILQKRMREVNLELSIREINDVDEFIKDNVHSIPAIRYNNNWLLECGQEEDISEFTNEVLQKIMSVKKVTNKIVVPVDFSEASQNALSYAAQLAQKCGCILEMVHVYHPTPVQVNGQVWVNPDGEKPFVKQLDTLFEKTKQRFKGLQVDKQFLYGFPVDELVTLSRLENTRFVVMGTTGASDGLKQLFGSVSQEVSQKAHCPVFAIPPEADFEFEKILYATDDPVLDSSAIKLLENLMEDSDTHLKIVHIKTPDQDSNKDQWLKDIPTVFPDLKNYDVGAVTSDSVVKGILQAADEDGSDIIAVATRKRSFWSSLFHKSTTKELLTQLGQHPLMIFHNRED